MKKQTSVKTRPKQNHSQHRYTEPRNSIQTYSRETQEEHSQRAQVNVLVVIGTSVLERSYKYCN